MTIKKIYVSNPWQVRLGKYGSLVNIYHNMYTYILLLTRDQLTGTGRNDLTITGLQPVKISDENWSTACKEKNHHFFKLIVAFF